MEVQINELKEKRRKGKTPFTQHGARQNLPIREIHEEKKKKKKEDTREREGIGERIRLTCRLKVTKRDRG